MSLSILEISSKKSISRINAHILKFCRITLHFKNTFAPFKCCINQFTAIFSLFYCREITFTPDGKFYILSNIFNWIYVRRIFIFLDADDETRSCWKMQCCPTNVPFCNILWCPSKQNPFVWHKTPCYKGSSVFRNFL